MESRPAASTWVIRAYRTLHAFSSATNSSTKSSDPWRMGSSSSLATCTWYHFVRYVYVLSVFNKIIFILLCTFRHPAHLMGPSQYRAKMLFDEFYLQCKCPSCKSNRPPYEWPDLNGLDKRILPLIMPMHRLPGQTISRSVKFDRSKLAEYEKLIIEYLHGMDRQHPNNATLRLQLLLMQIWNKQLMVCMD